MSKNWRGAYALLLTAAVAGNASAEQAGGEILAYEAIASSQPSSDVELVSCESCDTYGGDTYGCDDGTCLTGNMGGGIASRLRPFVGAEYLSVRANFSEATAYRSVDLASGTETFEQFDFDYGDSYRVFAGVRLGDCGAELRFTYTNFDSTGGFGPAVEDGETISSTTFNTIAAPFEVVPAGVGDSLSGTASVEVDNYDFGFAKTIPLGSPLDSCGCGDVCDPCGCAPWCPAWDIQWTGGIRVANVDSELNYASTILPANNGVGGIGPRTARSVVEFDGVGLRSGLIGRRYIGRSGYASVFVRGDISLLLGEVDSYVQTTGGALAQQPRMTTTEVIPVTELEAGGTLYLTPKVHLTGGYLLSAWHDLGHRFEYDYSVAGTNNLVSGTGIVSADDANMLMFDGWFVRLEAFF